MNAFKVIGLLLVAGIANAQTSYTQSPDVQLENNKNRGVKLGIMKSALDVKSKATASNGFRSRSEANKEDADQEIGFFVGWQDVRPYAPGYNFELSYNMFDEDMRATRLEGGLNYGLNDMFHVFGGLNVNVLSSSNKQADKTLDEFNSELGFQAGLGANIQNFNLSLKYLQTKNTADYTVFNSNTFSIINVDAEIVLRGVELTLGVTF